MHTLQPQMQSQTQVQYTHANLFYYTAYKKSNFFAAQLMLSNKRQVTLLQ